MILQSYVHKQCIVPGVKSFVALMEVLCITRLLTAAAESKHHFNSCCALVLNPTTGYGGKRLLHAVITLMRCKIKWNICTPLCKQLIATQHCDCKYFKLMMWLIAQNNPIYRIFLCFWPWYNDTWVSLEVWPGVIKPAKSCQDANGIVLHELNVKWKYALKLLWSATQWLYHTGITLFNYNVLPLHCMHIDSWC